MAKEKFICPRCGKKRPADKAARVTFEHSDGAVRSFTVCEKCCVKIQAKALSTTHKAKRREKRGQAVGLPDDQAAADEGAAEAE